METQAVSTLSLSCSGCSAVVNVKPTKKGNPRPPQGWKHDGDDYCCPRCWGERFMLRAITVPVAFPIGRKSAELWEALRACWQQATEISNFAVTELAKADIVRSANDAKLPKQSGVYLYPAARQRCPDVTPQSVVSLLQSVERRYRKRRYEVVWQAKASLPTYRYPIPYPVHNQAWSLEQREGGRYVVVVRLNGETWELALRGGHQFRRQRAALDKMISGEARRGELALYRVSANHGDHRTNGSEDSEGKKSRYRVMAKLVAWLPRSQHTEKERASVLHLTTSSTALWSVKDDEYTVYADQVKQWITGHLQYLKRSGDDLIKLRQAVRDGDRQAEKAVAQLGAERDRRVKKQYNRIHSACQMWSAAVAKFAVRRNVAEVRFDYSDKSYFQSFDWTMLVNCLSKALDDYGIHLVASGDSLTETPGRAREE